MSPKTTGNPPAPDDYNYDLFGQIPELPSVTRRWTVRRKSAIVEAVRAGWVPVEEVCQLYHLSVDELLAWERDIERYGVPGLRATRYQIYRQTNTPGKN